MIRFAALFAIIAFVVMSTGMAVARPAPIAAMPMMMHGPTAPAPPCGDAAAMACDICCAIAPAMAPIQRDTLQIRTGFVSALATAQTGLAIPPALPPPRPSGLTL